MSISPDIRQVKIDSVMRASFQFSFVRLELRRPGRAGVGNHVADVGHAGAELDHPFQPQAETGVRHAAETAEAQAPFISSPVPQRGRNQKRP